MQSYPFTSQVTYDEQGLPLYDRAVNSEFLRDVFKQYFSDGVFYSGNAACLQVAADTGMQVKVSPGACHIQGAMGIEYYQRTLVVQAAGAQDRIDTVVARLDLSVDARKIDLYVRQGTPGESPSAPALTRDSTTWELGLANLFIAKNTSRISQERITDTRLDTDRCGMVAAAVQPPFDTEEFFAQLNAAIAAHQQTADDQIADINSEWETTLSGINAEWDGWKDTTDEDFAAWFQHIKDQLDEDAAGHLQLQVDEINDTLATGAITTYQHRKIGTEHHLIGKGPNGKTQMTADVDTGDTVVLHDCADVDGLVIEGETTQAGTGDPSPDNIRPITGVGMYDQCVVLDGSDDESWTWMGSGNIAYAVCTNVIDVSGTLDVADAKTSSFPIVTILGTNEMIGCGGFNKNLYMRDPSRFGSEAETRAWLSSHPLTVWYQSVNYATHTGPWYTVVELSRDPYSAVGFELAQPLFDGDTLQVNVPSGCDQMVVLDGTENWGIDGAFYIPFPNGEKLPVHTDPNAKANCIINRYFGSTNGDPTVNTNTSFVFYGATNPSLYVRYAGISDVSTWKQQLADWAAEGRPLTIFYRSVNYTPDKDIPVVLEKHGKGLKIVSGTESITVDDNGTTDGYDAVYLVPCVSPVHGSIDLLSSHYKGVAGISPASGKVGVRTAESSDSLIFEDSGNLTSLEAAKDYFAAQQAAGTPVQVVYELAIPAEYARLYDGTTLPAYMGTEDFGSALDGEPVSGKWFTFTQDGTQVNFKGGGGLSDAKLAAANTSPGDVRTGKKFYAGDKTIKTGTLPVLHMGESNQINRWQNSTTKEVFIQANTIPEGIYESDGNTWSPQINIPAELFGNAAAAQVLAGITFTSQNGAKIAGTMTNRPGHQETKIAFGNGTGSIIVPIPKGAYLNNGESRPNNYDNSQNSSIAFLAGTATPDKVLTGNRFCSAHGVNIAGTMPNRGAPNQTLGIGGSYSISAGYYSGGKISAKGSFGGSGFSGDKSGSYAEIYRNESNVTREIQARSHASASISGKTVTITVHAEAYQRANDIPSLSGTKSSVDYSFSFTIS